MKRIVCVLLVLISLLSVFCLSSCGDDVEDSSEPTKLSFSGAVDINTINSLDGKKVSITGYMATLSPVNGKFMYLMNLPYQSCPFCKPNTTSLANTIAVYSKSGDKFDYTDQAITVTGVIEVGDYTDEYGYQYNYRIKNATYKIVDLTSAENSKLALWYSIASDGIVTEINTMFDYLYFICSWPEYYVNGSDGSIAYYLYPTDVQSYLTSDTAYGYAKQYAEGYFPGLIKRAKAITETELQDLIDMITAAKALEQRALKELNDGNYTYSQAEGLSEGEMKYKLNAGDDLNTAFYEVYNRYQDWIASWEV